MASPKASHGYAQNDTGKDSEHIGIPSERTKSTGMCMLVNKNKIKIEKKKNGFSVDAH